MYTLNMVACELCGKEVKSTQGLSGHYRFVHQLERSASQSALSITEQGSAAGEQVEQLEYARSGIIPISASWHTPVCH